MVSALIPLHLLGILPRCSFYVLSERKKTYEPAFCDKILFFFFSNLKAIIIIWLEPAQDKSLIKSFRYEASSLWDWVLAEKNLTYLLIVLPCCQKFLFYSMCLVVSCSLWGPQFVSHLWRHDCHTHSKFSHWMGNCGNCLSQLSVSVPLSADTIGLTFKLHIYIH